MSMLLPVLAAVSEPAPAGRSSPLAIAIILVCLAALAGVAVLAATHGGRRGDDRATDGREKDA